MARTRSPQPPRRPARRGENPSRLDATENSRHDRAWLAVKAFNETVPTLTSFARAITGKKSVRVVMSKTRTATDSENIYIVPPIELGDRIPHDRTICEKRDPVTKILLCRACATRELVMGRLFHELAHITGDSHAKPLQYERRKIKDMIMEWHPLGVCGHSSMLLQQASVAGGHQSLSEAFHPFLSGILKSIEDARVDSKMYRARPGLKVPTAARRRQVFSKGVNHLDGTTTLWRDAPLNVQVIIGLLMVAAGEIIEDDYLAPEVIEVLRDEELTRIAGKTLIASSVHNSLEISIEVFLRLQEMGVLYVPKCVPIPSMNAEPDDQESDDDANSGGGSDTSDSDSKDESSGDSDDAGEQPESGQSDGAGSGDDAGDDEDDDKDDGGQDDKDDLGDGSRSFENESSRGSGDDQEGDDPDDESDDGDVPSDDDREDPAEQGDPGPAGDDDPGAGDSDSAEGDPSEPEPGDEDGEPGSAGGGGGEPAAPEDDADQEPREGDDGSGESDDDGSDGESDEDAEGDGAGAVPDPGDDSADAEADTEADVEDDAGAGEGDGDLDPTEDDLDGAEAPGGVKDSSVWDQENPEDFLDGPGDEPELDPIEFDGTPEEVVAALQQFLGHGHEEEIDAEILDLEVPSEVEEHLNEQAVKVAAGQQAVFDTSSHTVRGVEVVQYPWKPFGWMHGYPNIFGGDPSDFMPSEAIIGSSLMQARLVFSANKLAKNQGNLKSGRINTRVLGRRAAIEDPRLFKRKTMPGKRDYFVVIGIDCSGSTQNYGRNARIKRAVFAKAELLNRLGIQFAIYGHTGAQGDVNKGWDHRRPGAYDGLTEVWMMEVKSPDEPWNDKTRKSLADLPPVAENLDGHSLEFYRKVAEKSRATDRIVMYYTDGAMPAANYEEELAILQSEIVTCGNKGISLMAVGINTDSPERYGFDTVQVDGDEDLSKVVAHLKKKLVG